MNIVIAPLQIDEHIFLFGEEDSEGSIEAIQHCTDRTHHFVVSSCSHV